ncbi:NUDIX domain-containing protein [Sphingomonas crocodyli]|uniref:NUDIX hydrolase n=1 Tax=Sphingomonas crocodyli TaxID=1979270 RepID=A0A437M019_9SPHN|nr:NUDIX domain-containing protein [Sphingomonas crocodyli]RVT90943.1 NUDIX hydrolase [Sphingomonas crocodyli]
MAPDPPPAIPAATVILLRDRPDGAPPQILMVQRAPTMAFAPGAIVFPGGRVDEADRSLACEIDHGLTEEDAAARIAAIRETIEEVGLFIGMPPPPAATGTAVRLAMRDGMAFATALRRWNLTLDLPALEPWSRWRPGAAELPNVTRIFDTRFYIARAPDDTKSAAVDGIETIRLRWASAAEFIADCDAAREFAIFPTRCNLERLTQANSHAALIDFARRFDHPPIIPWIDHRGDEPHLRIPDTLGYPITSRPTEEAQSPP